MDNTFDVAIVGAGMVGTTLACLLAKQGFKISLIDHGSLPNWQSGDENRVSALNQGTIRILQYIDTWSSIQKKAACAYSKMRVWEEHSLASISFNAEELGYPDLGYIVDNNAVISTLGERLRQNYQVSIFENKKINQLQVHDTSVSLEVEMNTDDRPDSTPITDILQIRANLVIGADGSQSIVRELCDIQTRFHDYEQQAIVTTVTLEGDHQNTAWQCFLDSGPVAMLPLQDGRCSVVWSCDNEKANTLKQLSDGDFCAGLSRVFQSSIGKVIHCSERRLFPIRQHHAEQYLAKRVALIGDAAHTTHPLAGLGANIGFMDAAVLAEIIQKARANGKNIGNQSILRRYERSRKGENARVLALMKTMQTLFASRYSGVKMARQIGLDAVNQIPAIKNQLALHAMGLGGDVAEICQSPHR